MLSFVMSLAVALGQVKRRQGKPAESALFQSKPNPRRRGRFLGLCNSRSRPTGPDCMVWQSPGHRSPDGVHPIYR